MDWEKWFRWPWNKTVRRAVTAAVLVVRKTVAREQDMVIYTNIHNGGTSINYQAIERGSGR